MAFELQVAEAADGPRIADVFFAAFADEFDRKMLPPNQPDVRSWMEKMILGEGPDTGKEILLKVVDPSNPEVIAGFARWVFPVREPHADDEKQDQNWSGWPEGADPELCDTFFSTMEKHHKEVMGDRPHYYLDILGVHPSYQRRGLASKLLHWGLKRADQEGVETYLAASPDGKPVYERNGFELVDKSFSPYPGTGATGYIGGDALAVIHNAHPEFSYVALVRSTDKADQVKAQFPNVQTVIGDLDNSALLERESAAADIVLHTADASDHEGAAKAIATGLVAGHNKENPGYWLHTGGTGILTFEDSDKESFGNKSDKIYDDWDGVKELLTLPDHAFHRNVDKIVLEAAEKHADVLKVALICPPTIYGRGRGPGSKRGRQVYELANVTLRLQKGPIIGGGDAIWNNVHVHDLSDVYALLVDAAAAGRTDKGLWGPEAYYLTENGEHRWGDVAQSAAEAAAKQGFIPEAKAEPIDLESAKKYAGFESLSWGMNSRGRALRAREILGWNPSNPSLLDELPEIVRSEWQRLQK
ncbi:hypothetical protein POX_h09743 [Penicillium oxalicum]|uniref:hypothetical protein n=1 Tax=Penicillium oxalicum TaxID=69781 RepID=UPI0020B711E4|nr:hypothetical protein POX_h09743 [Penicillium oxalicum]KAI2785978.1 hypothetical protein POX_h09743 [Penicillium oxalicum]